MPGVGASGRPPGRRRYHLHLPGLVYLLVTVFLAIGAFNSQNNLLFWAFGLAIAGVLVSGIVSGWALLGVRVDRRAPSTAWVGEPIDIQYVVSSRNRLVPAVALHVEEVGAMGAERGRARPLAFVALIGPGQSVRTQAAWMPTQRGPVRLGAVRIWSTFPFGIVKKSVTFEQAARVLVRPARLEIRSDVLDRVGQSREAASGGRSVRGDGEEFHGLRDYAAGDPSRMIAWRPSARVDRLLVREYESPPPRSMLVVLGLEPNGRSAEIAIALAASLIEAAARRDMAVGLATAGVRARPAVGRAHAQRLVEALALIGLGPEGMGARIPHPGSGRNCRIVAISPEATRWPGLGGGAMRICASDPGAVLSRAGLERLPVVFGSSPSRPRRAFWRRRLTSVRAGSAP